MKLLKNKRIFLRPALEFVFGLLLIIMGIYFGVSYETKLHQLSSMASVACYVFFWGRFSQPMAFFSISKGNLKNNRLNYHKESIKLERSNEL